MKIHYFIKAQSLYKIYTFLVVLFCGFTTLAQVNPVPVDSTQAGFSVGKIKIGDPKSILSSYQYDPVTDRYIYTNKVDGLVAPIYTGELKGQGVSGTLVQTIQNGLPINAFYTRKYLGMDKTTGIANYEDNGNTFYYVGNPNPKTVLGLSTTVRYMKLSLTINMNGDRKSTRLNSSHSDLSRMPSSA